MGTLSKTVNSEANESERKILPLVDTHAHLDYFERKAELSSIVDRAKLAGVCGMKYINGQNTVTYFGGVLYR